MACSWLIVNENGDRKVVDLRTRTRKGVSAAVRRAAVALRDGDIISIDIPGGKLDVELSDEEIKRRLTELPPFQPKVTSGYLRRYAARVTSASTGAVLRDND